MKKWTISPEVGLKTLLNEMDSHLFFTGERRGRGETHLWSGMDFSNQFSWNQINPYSELQLNYNNSAVKVNIRTNKFLWNRV